MTIEDVRAAVVRRFAGVLGDEDAARKLEIVLYNSILRRCVEDKIPLVWGGVVRERYTSRAVGLDVYNLRPNPELCRRLVSGELPLKKFVQMKPWEISPERWAAAFEKAAKRQLGRDICFVTREEIESMPDGALQCSSCKSKKTTYTELQTRSADEPTTVFALCLCCGKRWKQ